MINGGQAMENAGANMQGGMNAAASNGASNAM